MQPSLDFSGTIAAKVRHDLRNPLSDILGFCDVLREEAVERGLDQLLSDFTLIHAAASRIFADVNHALSPESLKLSNADFSPLEATIRLHAEKILSTTESLSAKCDLLEPNSFGDDLLRISSSARKLRDASPALLARIREVPAELAAASAPIQPPESDTTHFRTQPGPLGATATLLVVDDNESNRALLARRLRRQGYTVVLAENGRQALDKLRLRKFDLVLLDVIMPEMDGYRVLAAMKSDDALRHIPVIMISALDDLDVLARCIEAGAEDYLSKPFDPVLLKARIDSCLDKKRIHDQEQRTYQALVESQKHLAAELAEAGRYVQFLLPSPCEAPIRIDWRFLPSTQLGGDIFDYRWLDAEHFAFYLLDVCSHGVGAALLSVSVMNVIRSGALPGVDPRQPGDVLRALNEMFQMDRHNQMFFTIWYGIYHAPSHQLAYACGGHPPAILLTGPDQASNRIERLKAPGPAVGALSDVSFATNRVTLDRFNQLYLFSDGVYEVVKADGSILSLDDFVGHLAARGRLPESGPEATISFAQGIQGCPTFADDVSLLELRFPTRGMHADSTGLGI
jgi:sigma-B regulation protein RsbU (phosphoserine phosphatase)